VTDHRPSTWIVDVTVMPKAGVNDPEGEAIRNGLRALGHADVGRVHAGRLFALEIEAPDAGAAKQSAARMADELLANPVIERFAVSVRDGGGE
jgi:phosphoribosylformylglycinamidine synthase